MVYDTTGRLEDVRTLDSTGSLLSRTRYGYRPGFPTPQLTTTSYWGDGKSVRSLAQNTYDANGNFTAEKVANFDQAGKQTAGHILLHDPLTNIYHCSTWNAGLQKYAASECPASEGSTESAGESKPITREEALRNIEAAHATRRRERMEAQNRPIPKDAQLAFVLPAPLKPGEVVSGTVVEDAPRFLGRAGLTVVPIVLPEKSGAPPESLSDWMVESPGEAARPANGPITFTVPIATPRFHIVLRAVDDPSRAATLTFHASLLPALPRRRKSGPFAVSPLCLRGDLCPVSGPFHGQASQTVVALEDLPGSIVAESEERAYIRIPELTPPGPHQFLVSEGDAVTALSVVVADLKFSPNRAGIEKGQSTMVQAILSGPDMLPDDDWHPLPSAKEGAIRLIVYNATPAAATLRGAKNPSLSFDLTPKSFEGGEFKYSFVMEGLKTAPFFVWGEIVPLLKPVEAAPFPAPGFAMKRALLATLVLAAAVYLGDYVSLRLRIPNHREPFGTVMVERDFAVALKNRQTEFMFNQPQPQPCVYSLFPHLGDPPCWYLARHARQRVNM